MGRIKNLILGSESEQASVTEANRLRKEKSKRDLDYGENTRFDNAFSAWIRLRARQVLMGGSVIAAGLAGYGLFKDSPEVVKEPSEIVESKVERADAEAKYRELYDRGFAKLMASIPDQAPADASEAIRTLSFFKNFGTSGVSWSLLDASTKGYSSVESGLRVGSWKAIIPPELIKDYEADPLLHIDGSSSINVLQIQPAEVSEEWAGIFLVHELVHLFDREKKIEPLHPDRLQYLAGEARAYKVELLAVNYVSEGQYSRVMEEELTRLGITSLDGIYKIYESKRLEEFEASFIKLDQTIGSGPPKSTKEKGNRSGFHIMAMGRYLIDKTHPEGEGKTQAFKAFIEKIMVGSELEHAIPDTQKSEDTPKIEKADLEKRLREKQAWLKTLEDLVKKTKNPKAQAVLDFVRDNGIVGLPRIGGDGRMEVQVPEEPEGVSWFNFVPLVKEDEDLGGAWQQYTVTSIAAGGIGAAAHFLPGLRTIIVKGNAPMSDTFKGIMFAHEGFHARTYLSDPYNWEDRHTFCKRERDAHNFQDELMVELGGATYKAVLEDEIERMGTILTAGGSKVGGAHVGRAEYDARLEQAFGASLSDYEKATRGTQVWIHANFEMIDSAFPNPMEAKEEKAELYCSILPPDSK